MHHGFWWQFWRLTFKVLWSITKGFARFAVGLPVDGIRRTDATFIDNGTRDMREPSFWSRRNVSKWAALAGWKRMVIRWSVVISLPFIIFMPESRFLFAILLAGWVAFKIHRRSQAKSEEVEFKPPVSEQVIPDHFASMDGDELMEALEWQASKPKS